MRPTLVIAASVAALLTVTGQPQAQNNRSFVSGHGSDSNPCSLADPCRSFAQAITQTNAGGEITVLDTAGYGALTITKSISIVNPGGVEAGITVPSGGTGITIAAGPNDKISLRGLIIEGAGIGATGIAFTSGRSLTIEHLAVRNLTAGGIALAPTTSASIAVANTVVSDNGGHGIYLQPSGSVNVKALFNRVEVYNNALMGIGVYSNDMAFGTGLNALAVDCVSAFNGQNGYYALGSATGNDLTFRIFRSVASQNNANIVSDFNSLISVSESYLDKPSPWSDSPGGFIFSFLNNSTEGVSVPGTTFPLE